MSQENVEIVKAGFDLWNTGDMDAWRELFDPDGIMRNPEGWPEPGPQVGRDAVMHFLQQLRDTWDADTLELISDFIDVGDRVAVRFIWHGAGSGPDADLEMTGVYAVRKGKIVFLEFFWDHAEALEALGLSEQAISQGNVEIVRSICRNWDRGDFSSAEWADPEIEYVNIGGPSPGSWTGLADMAEGMRDVLSAWEDFRVTADQYRELDGERVLALSRYSGRGKTSGLDLSQTRTKAALLFHVRGGKVTRIVSYWDRKDALADLGLSEQDAHADS